MADMLSTPSVVDPANNYAHSYGFYDASHGWGVLDQTATIRTAN